jgi:hypothetical protein
LDISTEGLPLRVHTEAGDALPIRGVGKSRKSATIFCEVLPMRCVFEESKAGRFQPAKWNEKSPLYRLAREGSLDTMLGAQGLNRRNKKMADCAWPGGCKEGTKGKPAPAVTGSKFCSKHRLKQQADEKLKKEKEKAAKEQEERQKKQDEMALIAKKKQEEADARKKKIGEIKTQWNQQVKAVVQQVKNLRAHNPGVDGINAGNNAVGNTPGGKDSRLELKLPSDAKGILKGDIFPLMDGFDQSDSADLKIRVKDDNGNILVHIR